jgi:hypothetical protein
MIQDHKVNKNASQEGHPKGLEIIFHDANDISSIGKVKFFSILTKVSWF